MSEQLTVAEVAAELRVDETTVRRHIRLGNLAASKPFGVVRVARADLDTYLERCRVLPQQDGPPRPRAVAPSAVPQPHRGARSSVRDRLKADRQHAA